MALDTRSVCGRLPHHPIASLDLVVRLPPVHRHRSSARSSPRTDSALEQQSVKSVAENASFLLLSFPIATLFFSLSLFPSQSQMSRVIGQLGALTLLAQLVLLLQLSWTSTAVPIVPVKRGMPAEIVDKLMSKDIDQVRQAFNLAYTASDQIEQQLRVQENSLFHRLSQNVEQDLRQVKADQVQVPPKNHKRVRSPAGKSYSA